MASFQVNTDSLVALHDSLVGIHQQLMDLGGVVGGYEGRLASRDVEQSMRNFASTWSNGMNLIESDMEGMLQFLVEAAGAYQQAEQGIAGAASGHAGP